MPITSLASGLRVATHQMPQAHSVSIGIWVGAGARDEGAAEQGIAHMLEHMAFKGTASRTAQQIAVAVENVGGYMNAHTSREETAYYIRVLPEHMAMALDILFDIIGQSTLPPEEIERERGVIIQEIGQALDTPDDLVFDRFSATCYPDQSFGQPILGTIETVSGFKRDDLNGFMDRHYSPNQMLVVAAGQVVHDEIVDIADRLCKTIGRTGTTSARTPPRWQAGTDITQRDLEQSHLLFGLACPNARSDKRYEMVLLSSLYGEGMSSRLFQKIREERGLCYSIYSFAHLYSDGGILGVYAGTSPQQADEALKLSAEALADIAVHLDEAEFMRAKAQLRAGVLMGQESVSGIAESMAHQILLLGGLVSPEERLAKIDAVTMGGVQGLVSDLLENADPTLAVVGPKHPVMDNIKLREYLRS